MSGNFKIIEFAIKKYGKTYPNLVLHRLSKYMLIYLVLKIHDWEYLENIFQLM